MRDQRIAVEVQQVLDSREIIRQRGVVPAVGRMPGEVDGERDVADARHAGIAAVDEIGEQLRQMPGAAQGELQFEQRDAEHFCLHRVAAKRLVGFLPVADLQRQSRCETPQQDLCKIVKQGGDGHFLDVHVVAPDCPFVRVVRGALHATDLLQRAEHRRRVASEHALDGREFAEFLEKGLDAEHHQCRGDGRDVMA